MKIPNAVVFGSYRYDGVGLFCSVQQQSHGLHEGHAPHLDEKVDAHSGQAGIRVRHSGQAGERGQPAIFSG